MADHQNRHLRRHSFPTRRSTIFGNRIRVGAGSNLQDGTVVHGNHDRAGDYRETGGGMPTVIGDNVVVGHQAMLHACTLEDGAFVGMAAVVMDQAVVERSEEHTSELQSLMRISYAVFCLKQKNYKQNRQSRV